MRIIKTWQEAHQRGLAGPGWTDNGHDLARRHDETDVLERIDPTRIAESNAIEDNVSSRAIDRHGIRCILDLGHRVHQFVRHIGAYDLVLKRADRVADGFE